VALRDILLFATAMRLHGDHYISPRFFLFSNSVLKGHRTELNQTLPHVMFVSKLDLKTRLKSGDSWPKTWAQKMPFFGRFYDDNVT